jgi:CTP synthase (UTP-ammonia lyase)
MINKIKVAIMGNMNENYAPHYNMNRCFVEFQQSIPFEFEWVPTEQLENEPETILSGYRGIVAGSGPYRSKTGVISGIRYARKNNVPFLGTCSGFGYAVLEFGQHLFDLETVYHPYENKNIKEGETFLASLNDCDVGMHTITFKPVAGTLTDNIYQQEQVSERSHCSYGINPEMICCFEAEGFQVSGFDAVREPKIMEYRKNEFFVVTLFLPQFNSGINNPHPLLARFFKTIQLQHQKNK